MGNGRWRFGRRQRIGEVHWRGVREGVAIYFDTLFNNLLFVNFWFWYCSLLHSAHPGATFFTALTELCSFTISCTFRIIHSSPSPTLTLLFALLLLLLLLFVITTTFHHTLSWLHLSNNIVCHGSTAFSSTHLKTTKHQHHSITNSDHNRHRSAVVYISTSTQLRPFLSFRH